MINANVTTQPKEIQYIATQVDGVFNQKAHIVNPNDLKEIQRIARLYDPYKTDVYITPQTYREGESRAEANIIYLKRIVIDLDINFKHFTDQTKTLQEANRSLQAFKEYLVEQLYSNVFNRTVEPSSVLDSGVGIHIRIDLDNETDLKLYSDITHYLAKELDRFFIDQNINELIRVDKTKLGANNFFRLEGTINSKNGIRATLMSDKQIVYTFNEILEELDDLEGFIKHQEDLERITRDFNPSNPKWTLETYARGLSEDLKRVQGSFNRKGMIEGHRYMLLHIYSNTIRIINHDTRTLYYKIDRFNQRYINPLPQREVTTIYKNVIRKQETDRIPKYYLISLFNITYQEQRANKILVGQVIKQERNNQQKQRNRARKSVIRNELKEQQNHRIIDLYKLGKTQREIVELTSASKGTVYRAIKAYKQTQKEQ